MKKHVVVKGNIIIGPFRSKTAAEDWAALNAQSAVIVPITTAAEYEAVREENVIPGNYSRLQTRH